MQATHRLKAGNGSWGSFGLGRLGLCRAVEMELCNNDRSSDTGSYLSKFSVSTHEKRFPYIVSCVKGTLLSGLGSSQGILHAALKKYFQLMHGHLSLVGGQIFWFMRPTICPATGLTEIPMRAPSRRQFQVKDTCLRGTAELEKLVVVSLVGSFSGGLYRPQQKGIHGSRIWIPTYFQAGTAV